MKIQNTKRDRLIIIKLDEERLGSNYSPMLKAEFVTANNEGFRNIILDISDVQYIDSSGLSALLVGNRLCEDASGKFVIASPSTSVQKLIKISQLELVLNVIPTLDEALDFVMMQELVRDLLSV